MERENKSIGILTPPKHVNVSKVSHTAYERVCLKYRYVHQDIPSMLIAALKRREGGSFPTPPSHLLGWLGWALTTGKKGKEEESRANPRRTKKEEALIPTTPLTLLPGCFFFGGGENPRPHSIGLRGCVYGAGFNNFDHCQM